MKSSRAIWIVLLLLTAAPADRSAAFLEGMEFDPSQISQAGQEIIDRLAPESFKGQYRFPSTEEIVAVVAPMQSALVGDSVEALAALQPRARQALDLLRAYPQTQAYADWLEARMDFFEMAAEVGRAIPAPPHPPASPQPLPPHSTGPQKPLPPHSATPQPPLSPHSAGPATAPRAPPPAIEKARNRYVENKQVWVRKLSGRPAPARAAALLPDLKKIFRAEGIPPELVWQAEAESTFNPAARSPVGAAGLYQFMPATAQQYGLKLSPDDERLDALKNARAAARYLKVLHGRFGDWPLAFAAYNCGEGRVSKTLRTTGGKTFDDIHDQLPAETRMYVPKIAALVQLRENADLDRL